MWKTKKSLIAITISMLLAAFVISGCTKPAQNQPVVVDNGKSEQNNQEQVNQEQPEKKDWQGELINDEGGWKKYKNDYYGIEFKFLDKDDVIKLEDRSRNGITLLGPREESGESSHYAYVYIDNFMVIDNNFFDNLDDYLKVAWNNYQEAAELKSIKKLKNSQGMNYYEVTARVDGGRQSPGTEYDSSIYYFDYNLLEDKDFISIRCPNINKCSEILESFSIRN